MIALEMAGVITLACLLMQATQASADPQVPAPEDFSQQRLRVISSGIDADSIYNLHNGEPTSHALTLHQLYEWRPRASQEEQVVTLRYRLMYDSQQPTIPRHIGLPFLEKLLAYASTPIGNAKVSVGYQEVTWGEGAFMPVLDVVNMRSLTHPRGFYDPAAKLPAAMLRAEYQSEALNWELIVVPSPEAMPQPPTLGDFDVVAVRDQSPLAPEYGGRIGTYWQGIDAKFYYFRHAARIPAYRFKAFGGDGDLIQDIDPENTFGMSASYAAEFALIRVDLAETDRMPATGIGTEIEHTRLRRGILAAFVATEDQQIFGLELHTDAWAQKPVAYTEGAFVKAKRGSETLNWLAFTSNFRLLNGKIEGLAIYYHGLENDDELVRVGGSYAYSDTISLGGDYTRTYAESRSPLLLLNKRESLAMRITWNF